MTSKGILRFCIAVVLVFIVFSIVLPIIGVPKDQLLPPPLIYVNSHGTATGYVTARKTAPSPNIFKAGDIINIVSYKFRGPAIPGYGKPAAAGETAVYTGQARCTTGYYDSVSVGTAVPVRFDPSFPNVNGISADGAGMTISGAGALLGVWILFDIAILVVAYFVAMLLERIMLRESY